MDEPLIPTRVGFLYDRLSGIGGELFGDDLHFGYWDDSTSGSRTASLPAATRRMSHEMVARLPVGPGDRVLDIGSGTGAATILLARLTGARVVGITVSADQVRLANARAEHEGVDDLVTFQFGDAMSPAFSPESFDAAWALQSLGHVPDRTQALQGIARVLKPGAPLLITDFTQLAPPLATKPRR